MPPTAFVLIVLVSSFPKPQTPAKESLAHRTLLDGFDSGWGGWVDKEATTPTWVHCGLILHCWLDLGLVCGNGESRHQRPSVSTFEKTLGTGPASQILRSRILYTVVNVTVLSTVQSAYKDFKVTKQNQKLFQHLPLPGTANVPDAGVYSNYKNPIRNCKQVWMSGLPLVWIWSPPTS